VVETKSGESRALTGQETILPEYIMGVEPHVMHSNEYVVCSIERRLVYCDIVILLYLNIVAF